IKPRASPGQIHVTGDLVQSAGGTIEVELAGTTAGEFDVVQVDGHALLGGTVRALPVGGVSPQPGDTYQFLTAAGGRTGVFAHLDAAAGPPWFEVLEQANGAALRVLTGPPVLTITLDTPPTVTISAEQRLAIPVTVSFPGSDVDVVVLSAQFSEPMLVPPANVGFTGAGRARVMNLRPDLLRSGTTLVTINAMGPGGATTNASFTLEITPAPPQGLVAWEPFDYAPANASLNTKNGGVGFATPWFAQSTPLNARVASGSLPYPLLRTAGNNVAAPVLSAGIGSLSRRLTQSLGTPGTTRYLSFLARPDGTVGEGAFNGFFGLLLHSAVVPDLFIGKPGGGATNHWAIEDAGGGFQQASEISAATGQVVLLVAKFDFESGNDRVSLFVNPVAGHPEPPTPEAVRTDRDLGKFQDLALNSTGAWSVDELRIGTTWESVTPDINQIAPLGLRPIPDQAAQEATFFGYAVQLQELVTPREAHFELINNPTGMQINDITGLISWNPPEDAGGQTFVVTVRVHDLPEPPVRSATTDFSVSVQEANQPPRLAFIPEIQLEPQPPRPFTLQLVAQDDDTPTNTFTFALVSGPTGLNVSADGLVTWDPPADQPPGPTPFRIRLTDFNAGAPLVTQHLSHEEDVVLNVQAAGPDPTVTVTAASVQVATGAEAVFEVEVLNHGTLPASEVELRLQLPGLSGTPPRVTLLEATSPGGDCQLGGDELRCPVGDLASDASVTVKVRLSFAVAGLETLEWLVVSATDLNSSNNHDQSLLQVVRPLPPTPLNPLGWEVQTAADEGELTAVRIAADPEGLPNLLSQLDTSRARLSIWDGYQWQQSGGGDDPPGGFPIAFRMLGQSREALLAPNPAQVNYFADLGLGVHYPLLLKEDNANPSDWPGYSIVRDALLPGGSVGRDDTAILYRVFHFTDELLDTWQDRTLARIINRQEGWPLVPPDLALLHPRQQFVIGTVASFGDSEFVAAIAQKRTNGLAPVMQIVYLPALTPGLDGWENLQTLCEIPAFDTFAYDELRYPPVAAARNSDRRVAVYADCDGRVWFAERNGTLWQTEQIAGVPAGVIRNLAVTLAPDGSPLVALVLEAPCSGPPPCPVDRRWLVAQRKAAWEFSQLDNVRDPAGGDSAPAGGTVVAGPDKFTALNGGLDVQFHTVGSDVRMAYNTGYPSHDIRFARLTPRWSQYLNLGVAGPDTYPRLAASVGQSPPHVAWSGALDTVNRGLYLGRFEALRGGLRFLAQVVEAVGHPANIGIGSVEAGALVAGDLNAELLRLYTVQETVRSVDYGGFASEQPMGIGFGTVLGLLPDGRPGFSQFKGGNKPPDPPIANPASPIPPQQPDAVAFASGVDGFDIPSLCLYHIGPPQNELRLTDFWGPSDLLLTTVDISSLPHGGRPLLRACWTTHAPFDDERNRGFVYAVYPRRENETVSLRVGRMDLSARTPVWEEITLPNAPPLDYGVQSVAIAAARESLKIAFTDETAYLLQADQIATFSRVAEASFEPLPFATPVRNIDLAANRQETWASYVSGDRVHVAALGIEHRLTSLWDAENDELLTSITTGGTGICPLETIWVFAGLRPRPGPEAPLIADSRKSPSKRNLDRALTRNDVDPAPHGLTAESLADPRLETFRGVRDLMLQTTEGRRLEALYRQHSEEVRRLLITNPDLLFASGSMLLNFVPSLDKWLQGRGANARVTTSMATQVNSLWSRLAAGANPELKAALVAEQTRFHNFTDFVGKNFDQWAALLQFPNTATTPAEFRILATSFIGGRLSVKVAAQTGVRFVLQRVSNLNSPTWSDVPNYSTETTGSEVTLTDPSASN
ncbi:MAG TPA: hypothetical protein DCE44_16680, partial [Verrucomicrobiales bacterium]|nr:hypothetical protein [Verrucomicrobiales bacterium]